MSYDKLSILANLDPYDPASIRALLDFHREAFGGLTMEDGEPNDDGHGDDGSGNEQDPPLGPNGEKALRAERDARKALERQLEQLTGGLKQALGITGQDAKSNDDVIATLQQKMDALELSNRVLQTANKHRITDEGDLALLRSVTDETAMQALAARLAPTDDDAKIQDGRKRTPPPDPDQGRGGGGKANSVAQVIADRQAARAAKNN